MNKIRKRILGISLFILGVIIYCCKFMEGFRYLGLIIFIWGINLFVYSFDFDYHMRKNKTKTSDNRKSTIYYYRNVNLNFGYTLDQILQVYFNDDHTKRITFYQKESSVQVSQEILTVLDQEEAKQMGFPAYWSKVTDSSSYYESLDIALKEWEGELRLYHQESLEYLFNKGSSHKYKASIVWQKDIIPNLFTYCAVVTVIDDLVNPKDAYIINYHFHNEKMTEAIFYYVTDCYTKLSIGTTIYIFEGSQKVAEGKIIEKINL